MALAPLLTAGISGIQSLFNLGQQNTANAINWRAVMEQARANRKQEQLQTADRADAYGNKLVYTPGVGWEYKLTGSTKGILDAEQRERLTNLREDAPRNRAAAERMDTRSQTADEEYKKRFNEYKYRPEKTEAEYVNDTRQTLLNSRKRGLDEAANAMSKQLLRTGNSSNVGKVYKQAANEYADTLQDVELNAKRLGSQQFRSDRDSDDNAFMKELQMLLGTSNQTTTSPVNFSGFNEQLTGRADQALQQLSQALAQGSQASQRALANYSQGVGNTSLDLSGIARALGSIGSGKQEKEFYPPRPGSSNGLW